MNNKNLDNKRSLNDKIIYIINAILYITIICIGIISVIAWEKTNDLIFIIVGPIGILGILFNIYLLSRAKSK